MEEPPRSPVGSGARQVVVDALVLGFIFLNLAVFLLGNIPASPFGDALLKMGIRRYMETLTFHQNWGMFSPDPPNILFHLEAEITFSDGSKKIWLFPRAHEEKFFRRILMGRHIEWQRMLFERKGSQRDIAVYIARLHRDPVNPPRKVILVNRWTRTAPPTDKIYQPMPRVIDDKERTIIGTFEINQEDLE